MSELGRFQSAFMRAVDGEADGLAPWLDAPEHPALAVYRNTIAKGLIDTLLALYPTLVRLVGQDWMSAAASAYIGDNPPTDSVLALYGSSFPDWLQSFEPALEFPYLSGVARCDQLWFHAHFAQDGPNLKAENFAAAFAAQTPIFAHPSLCLFEAPDNSPSLYLAHSEGGTMQAMDYVYAPQCLIAARRQDAIVFMKIMPQEAALPRALIAGGDLISAATTAVEILGPERLSPLVERLLALGAFLEPNLP